MKKLVLAATFLAVTWPAWAQHDHGPAPATSRASPMSSALTEGEVRRINKEAKQITLKHGPIANVDMPAMTMTFDVKDAALLDRTKAGDKVRFRVEKEGTGYVVTRLEPAK